MNLQTAPKKPFLIIPGILGIGLIVFFIVSPMLSEHFKTVYPKLEVHFPKNFSTEKILSFTGSVLAECNCEVSLMVNGERVNVSHEGTFEYSMPIGEESERKITVQAQTRGVFWDTSKQTNVLTETVRRANTPVKIDAPLSSAETSNEIRVHTVPLAKIKITGYYNRGVEVKGISPVVEAIYVTADESGNATASLPFENSVLTQSTSYRVRVEAAHYVPTESTFMITNALHDAGQVEKETERQRIAKEEADKREQEAQEQARKKTIADTMNKYAGNGYIQIAIATNGIEKSRSIGYYSVNDPANYQYIKIPVFAQNVGLNTEHVNPLNFTLTDSTGRTYNVDTATYSLGNGFEGTNLQPDTNTDGWLAFIVPKSEQEFTLIYSDGFSGVIRKEIIVW